MTSLFLMDSFSEKKTLLIKVINLFFHDALNGAECHYLLDLMIYNIIDLGEKSPYLLDLLQDLRMNLSFYEPDKNSRDQIPGNLFGDEELKELLTVFLKDLQDV